MEEPVRRAGKGNSCLKPEFTPKGSRPPHRLIIVDEDDACRKIVKAELEDEGFSVMDFRSGEAMLDSLEGGANADIVVLDWDGIDLLSAMRERGIDLPVVFMTARNSPIHERLAFQRGAVDFIDKSRGTGVLAARLHLIVKNKRQSAPSGSVFRSGHLLLQLDVGRASWKNIDVELTESEVKIVLLIASNVGQYLSYRKIYDAVHYEGFVAGSGKQGFRANVRSSIKRIRSKFRECDPTFDEIRNYTGFGYCWAKRSE